MSETETHVAPRRGRSSSRLQSSRKVRESDFMVKFLPDKGRAVFTTRTFKPGDFLLTYDGELIDADEGERREAIEETGFRYFFRWKGKKFCLDASVEPLNGPGLGRLVNHGWKREINSKMRVVEGISSKPNLALFAIKTILPYKEILYDYGLPASFKFPPPLPPPTCTATSENKDISEPNSLKHPTPLESLSSSGEQSNKDNHLHQENENMSQRVCHDNESLVVVTDSVPEVDQVLDASHISSVSTVSDKGTGSGVREKRKTSQPNSSAHPTNPLPLECLTSSGEQSNKDNHLHQENENMSQRVCHDNESLVVVTDSVPEVDQVLDASHISSVSTVSDKGTGSGVREKRKTSQPNLSAHPTNPLPLECLTSSGEQSNKDNNLHQKNETMIQRACHDNDTNIDAVREILNSSVLTIPEDVADTVVDTVVDFEENISNNDGSDCESVVSGPEDDYDPDYDYETDRNSSGQRPSAFDTPLSLCSRNDDSDDSDEPDCTSAVSDSEDDHDPDYDYDGDSDYSDQDETQIPRSSKSNVSKNKDLKNVAAGSAHKCEYLPCNAENSNVRVNHSGTDDEDDRKLYVMRTHNDGQNRCYDKIAYCLFCSKPQKKLPVHLLQHTDEVEVARYLAETEKGKKNELLSKIRNRGNHLHNYSVMEEGKGGLVVVYRPNYEANPNDYQPCFHCLGWYARTEMWKHKCYLNQKNEDGSAKKRANVVWSGRLLLPPAVNTESSDLLHRVLNGLRSGPIAMCIKQDQLILALGKQLSFKLAHDEENYNSIRCKLREVARLVLEYRTCSGNENAELATLISPSQFDVVLQAVRDVSGFNSESHLFSIPSLARKLGHSLKKAANLLLSKAIKEEDFGLEKKCKDFITLYDKDWETEISSHALRTMYQQKRNNPKILPLTTDVVALSNYLRKKAELCLESLTNQNDEDKMQSWRELNQLVLTHLIVFNRRRQGEISKMTLDDYSKCKKGESHMVEGQMEMLEKWEQHMVKLLWRVEVVGKRGRTVPVLMTNFAKMCIDALLHHRKQAGVNPMNTYLFAVPKSDVSSHLRGCDTLREHSKMCGAKQPALLRSTRLRKHIATMTQLMDLRDNELDVLANYMGHDVRIHREFYRLPDAAQQVAKISKILFAMEGKGGNPAELLGNATDIDQLQVHPTEVLNCDEDTTDEDSEDDKEVEVHEGEPVNVTVDTDADLPHRPTQKGQKRKWTDEERDAVIRQLGVFIENKKIPGKRDIDKCLKAEKHLKNRSWKNVKDFVRNSLTAKTRAAQMPYF